MCVAHTDAKIGVGNAPGAGRNQNLFLDFPVFLLYNTLRSEK